MLTRFRNNIPEDNTGPVIGARPGGGIPLSISEIMLQDEGKQSPVAPAIPGQRDTPLQPAAANVEFQEERSPSAAVVDRDGRFSLGDPCKYLLASCDG